MFKKTVEDFVCEHCGEKVKGNGFTNHCPNCLYSKHVDVDPGDRAEDCGGMMIPIEVQKDGQDFFVVQKCEKCGHLRRNTLLPEDNFDEAIKIANEFAKKSIGL